MSKRPTLALSLLALVILVGCSGADDPVKPIVNPSLPANDSPAGALARLEAALELQSGNGYRDLFTADYHFSFSNQTDPLLVAHYGMSWDRAHEDAAMRNVFNGFTDDQGQHHNGASTIVVTFSNVTIIDDSTHADSTAWYRVAQIPSALADITLPDDIGGVVSYEIDGRQDLAIVRGDAALLPAGIPADSTHWYVRQWSDLSSPIFVRAKPLPTISIPLPARSSTWGSLKAVYYNPPPVF